VLANNKGLAYSLRMSNTATLSAEQKRRIVESIEECNRFIDLESPRSEELRPQKTKELLAFYIEHRATLQRMLA
jgi:hypothetical protein